MKKKLGIGELNRRGTTTQKTVSPVATLDSRELWRAVSKSNLRWMGRL